jgi:carbonic anhydrase
MRKQISLLFAAFLTFGTFGCATSSQVPAVSTTIDQPEQSSITPDQAIERLKEGNDRFVSGSMLQRDYPAQVSSSSHGQYPYAAVLACMDSRSGPELVFDQGIGDLFVVRVAGNYATPDILGSLEYAAKVSGAKLIVVLGHTSCGAIKGACDNVQMGNLTTVINALRPVVEKVNGYEGDRTSKNKDFVYAVTVANVRHTVAHIRSDSPILKQMEQVGQIKIVGAMYDVETGKVAFFDWQPTQE